MRKEILFQYLIQFYLNNYCFFFPELFDFFSSLFPSNDEIFMICLMKKVEKKLNL